jgi:glycosyltransferase involved in cell wall biosynthesis
MIPTYNCANYLRETLNSVLVQDPGSELMQIEVVDDCSTLDDPEAVVKELGKGRVQFYRQPENVGYIKNFETCLQRSRGQLIHLLHGDDCVRDGFYRKMQGLFEEYPEIGAAKLGFVGYLLCRTHDCSGRFNSSRHPDSRSTHV